MVPVNEARAIRALRCHYVRTAVRETCRNALVLQFVWDATLSPDMKKVGCLFGIG